MGNAVRRKIAHETKFIAFHQRLCGSEGHAWGRRKWLKLWRLDDGAQNYSVRCRACGAERVSHAKRKAPEHNGTTGSRKAARGNKLRDMSMANERSAAK